MGGLILGMAGRMIDRCNHFGISILGGVWEIRWVFLVLAALFLGISQIIEPKRARMAFSRAHSYLFFTFLMSA
jgi:hypothetical protein